MEDIEYLEEYEDLVLPALNSAAAIAASSSNTFPQNQKVNDDEDDSSSLDQDIFNCLFDDNSDDDEDDEYNDYQKNASKPTLIEKPGSLESFDSLDDKTEELGEKVIQKLEISRQDPQTFKTFAKTANTVNSPTLKPKTFMSKTSGTTIPLNTVHRSKTTFANKAKSIATVRPTIQNQKQQQQKKTDLLQRRASSTSFTSIQRQKPSLSTASTSTRTVQLPVLARKPLSSAKSTSSSSLLSKKPTALPLPALQSAPVFKKVTKRPATIVKPEKIITKDPANDPLELDNLSQIGSDNYSLSDISGETYNSFSDFEDDDSNAEYYSGEEDYYEDDDISSSSQVIDISNDSSGTASNLEDLHDSTPSPVISDDSDIPSSSSGFKLRKAKSNNPYTNPDIIESVLRKGEKPKLLELLHNHNLLEYSEENEEEGNIVIDITASSEKLVESFDTPQVTSENKTLSVVPIQTDNNKSITSNPTNKNPIKHCQKTNKKKRNKKSVTNMDSTNDCRDLRSPGAASTDSDLSAVEELLEESYAEAMKREKGGPFSNQELGAQLEIGGEEEVSAIEENKQKLPKTDVVIDYDDIPIEDPVKANKLVETKTENVKPVDIGQTEKCTNTAIQQHHEINQSTNLLNNETKDKEEVKDNEKDKEEVKDNEKDKEEVKDNEKDKPSETTDSTQKQKEINTDKEENLDNTKLLEDFSSPNTRKKKRFRNLITPEPHEGSSDATKSMDDIIDFKGFEEVTRAEVQLENIKTKEQSIPPIETTEKTMDTDQTSASFKSPSNSHQSLRDKAKETKEKSSRDSSKESKEKSSKHSNSKSSRNSSKDRSSRESSRDKSSRESSKERSRESSKDRSKYSHDKDFTSKHHYRHHHKDHRKSSDSKDSSKSRESSKSRDSKDSKHAKADANVVPKGTNDKKDQSSEVKKENYTEKKDIKISKEPNKNTKDVVAKTCASDSKVSKSQDKKIDSIHHKSSSEKSVKKSADSIQKPKEKEPEKSLNISVKEHKQNSSEDTKKSSSYTSKLNPNSSRDSSNDRKNIAKTQDTAKSAGESKNDSKIQGSTNSNSKLQNICKTLDFTKSTIETKPESSKNPKAVSELKKSSTNLPDTSTMSDDLKTPKTNKKPTEVSKSLQDNKNLGKSIESTKLITKSANDSSLKGTPTKKTALNSPIVSKNINTPLKSSKNIEADRKEQQKTFKNSTLDSKKSIKINLVDVNKSDVKKTEASNTIKQISSSGSNTNRIEELNQRGSSSKSANIQIKDASPIKATSEKIQNIKPKEKSFDLKKPAETSKISSPLPKAKVEESKTKDVKTTLTCSKKTENPKNEYTKSKEEPTKALKQEDSKETTQKSKNSKPINNEIPEKTKIESNKPKESEEMDTNAANKNILQTKIEISKTKGDNIQQVKKHNSKEGNSKNVYRDQKNEDEKKDSMKTSSQSKIETSKNEQKEKIKGENVKITKESEKDKSDKEKNLTDQTQLTAKTDKIKEGNRMEEVIPPLKNLAKKTQSVLSPKSLKHAEKVEEITDKDNTLPTKSSQSSNKDTSKEVNIKNRTEKNKKETCEETNIKDNSTIKKQLDISLKITKLRDSTGGVETKDAVLENKKLESLKTQQLSESILINTEKTVTKKDVEDKTAIKPMKRKIDIKHTVENTTDEIEESMEISQFCDTNVVNDIAVEPRITRSRMELNITDDSKTEKPEDEKNKSEQIITSQNKDSITTEILENASTSKEKNEEKESNSSEEKKSTDVKSKIKTKEETHKHKLELSHTELSKKENSGQTDSKNKHSEPINTELETEFGKEKIEISSVESCEDGKQTQVAIKTRSGDFKEKSQVKSSQEILLSQRESEKEIILDVKTRSGDLGKKSEKSETQSKETVVEKEIEKKENFEPIRTRKRGNVKGEEGKETSNKELSLEISNEMEQESCEPVRTRRRVNQKLEDGKETSIIETSEEKSSSEKETNKEHIKPIKTRTRGNLKEEGTETSQIESPQQKSPVTKKEAEAKSDNLIEEKKENQTSQETYLTQKETIEHIQPMNSKKLRDLELETGKEKNETSQDESRKEHVEKPKTRSLKLETEKVEEITRNETSVDKSSLQKQSENIEPLKTRRRADPLKEASKAEVSNIESSEENIQTELEGEHNRAIKTRSRVTAEESAKKKIEGSDDKSIANKGVEEQHSEHIRTRKRGDIKLEPEKINCETNMLKSSKEQSSVKGQLKNPTEEKLIEPTKRGDPKEVSKAVISKIESSNENAQKELEVEHSGTIKTRSRVNTEESFKKKIYVSDDKSSANKEVEEQHIEHIKTRKSGDIKLEPEKSNCETNLVKSSKEQSSVEVLLRNQTEEKLVEPTKHGDHKEEVSQAEISKIDSSDENAQKEPEAEHSGTIKTRSRVNTEESVKNKTEGSEDKNSANKEVEEQHIEHIKTRKRGDIKLEPEKINCETNMLKSSKEQSSVEVHLKNPTEEKLIEPTKTKSHGDPLGKTQKDKPKISQTVSKEPAVIKKSTENKKTDDKVLSNIGDKNVKIIITKSDKGTQEGCPNQIEPIKTRKQTENLKSHKLSKEEDETDLSKVPDITVTSNVNAKQTEELKSSVNTVKVNQEKNTEIEMQDLTHKSKNLENLKCSQENLNSGNDMSASESSITSLNSDNTLQRTLRKRGTESPFPENDNNKKPFKEPLLVKSAARHSPKSAKKEKTTTSALSTGLKRPLRSPTVDTESPSSNKKSKLETSKKTDRFRNLHDDCLKEEELPVVTLKSTALLKEQDCLQKQPSLLEEQKLNEFSKRMHKTLQNKTAKEVKETSQNTFISKKKDEENVRDNKTSRTHAKLLQKEVLVRELAKEQPNKGDSNVNVKKSLQEEEIKSKPDKTENIANAKETPVSPQTNKTKDNTSINKLGGSVITFSDWLKTKSQNTSEVNVDVVPTDLTKEITPARQSKEMLTRLTPKTFQSKPIDNKQKSVKFTKEPQKQTHMTDQNTEKVSDLRDKEQKESCCKQDQQTMGANDDDNTTLESINSSQLLNNSLLKPADIQPENELKHGKNISSNKKPNAKQNTLSKKSSKQQTSPTKSLTTPPKIKKSEIDLLMESMSKEMKDGGINELLNTTTHVKRHRINKNRNIGGAEQLKSNPTLTTAASTTTAAAVVQLPTTNTISGGLRLKNDIPKVLDFSENLEILQTTTTPTPKEMPSRSPTKRKSQQNNVKAQKVSGRRSVINMPDIPAAVPKPVLQAYSKEFLTKSRKSLNIKESPLLTTAVEKLRRSMPHMSKESLVGDTNVVEKPPAASKKSEAISKQKTQETKQTVKPLSEAILKQKTQETKQTVKPLSDKFKTPNLPGTSAILNQITNARSIKHLYTENKKSSDRHLKIHQTAANVLRIFKCRNLSIRLNRSIVRKYLQSLNNREKQILAVAQANVENVPDVPAQPTEILPIIQNNPETSLRLQSVVNASTLLNTQYPTAVSCTQDLCAEPNLQRNTATLPGSSTSTISIRTIEKPSHVLPTITTRNTGQLTAPLISVVDGNETIELKNEFMDENPIAVNSDVILPDTPTLLARAQSITEAAHLALSNSVTPTDIRLLTTDSSSNSYVPSFGVTPTALDNKGTCLYTFLHPARYNRNHSNVLLDYCCPNLDGPMPAIDPTRIHAQLQIPVIEVPASIVLTTKVVTRADLENGSSSVPAIIRKKAEKIRKNMATHHKLAASVSSTVTTQSATPAASVIGQQQLTPISRPALPPTINALTKQLPATTTITAKIRSPTPSQSQMLVSHAQPQPYLSTLPPPPISTLPKNTTLSVIPRGHPSQLSSVQQSTLRSYLRRFDVLLKQLVQPFESLSFVERHRIIEALIATGKFLPKDLEQTLLLMEEYIKQTLLLKNDSFNQPVAQATSAILSTNNYLTSQPAVASSLPTPQMPQLQPSPNLLASGTVSVASSSHTRQLEQIHNKAVRKVQSRSKSSSSSSHSTGSTSGGVLVKQRQVPIYDTDRNIIGYQMQMMTPMSTMPAYTKSTMSPHAGAIMSSSLDSSKITTYNKRPVKRPAQDSPRVFYTTPPLKTSTPKAITNPHLYPTQHSTSANTIAQKKQGSILTTMRSGGSSSSASSETITTTTTATVKRVTRSTATGSKIIIVSKSNQSSEETILPDANSSHQQQQTEQTEIKNEKDVEDFLG